MKQATLSVCLLLGACGSAPRAVNEGPTVLSETGLYADLPSMRLSEGLIELEPRFPLWSDGAKKRRFLKLPEGAVIDSSQPEAWHFPIGTQVWKEFSLDGQRIETRLIEKRQEPDDGGWFRMAYAWREDGSDADAVPDGVKGVRGLSYDIPSQRECGSCHYRGEKPVIGVSAMQLDGDGPHSIAALVAHGALSDPPTASIAVPGDPPVAAALGYLHGNCSHCHDSRSAAAAEVKIFMELHAGDTSVEATQAYKTLVGQPIHHFPDVGLKALVAPGDPDGSLVHYRMARRDAAQMPPLATRVVDEAGLATIDAWIRGLTP